MDYLIETFDLMHEEIQIFYGGNANFSQFNFDDYKTLDKEFNLEMKFERDFNILQHSFNLNFENGNFLLDPNFDFWWKEINKLIKGSIYEKISKIFINFLKNFN